MYLLQIQEAGFDILTDEERATREAEMRLFYQHRAGEVSFSASTYPKHSHFFLFLQHCVYRLLLVWEKIEYYEQQVSHELGLQIIITGCIRETFFGSKDESLTPT